MKYVAARAGYVHTINPRYSFGLGDELFNNSLCNICLQINPYSMWQDKLNDCLPGNLDVIIPLSSFGVPCQYLSMDCLVWSPMLPWNTCVFMSGSGSLRRSVWNKRPHLLCLELKNMDPIIILCIITSLYFYLAPRVPAKWLLPPFDKKGPLLSIFFTLRGVKQLSLLSGQPHWPPFSLNVCNEPAV